jgi:hypothetical protein
LYPKPDLQRLVSSIRDMTELAAQRLGPKVGGISAEAESELRVIITECIEEGIRLQRDALSLLPDDRPTREIPMPPKLKR